MGIASLFSKNKNDNDDFSGTEYTVSLYPLTPENPIVQMLGIERANEFYSEKGVQTRKEEAARYHTTVETVKKPRTYTA